MSPHIFDNITQIEEIVTEIDIHELDSLDRDELIDLIKKIMHHYTLDTVLTHLPQDKHQHFLTKYHEDPANMELLAWLKQEIKADIEKAIAEQSKKIKSEILSEIKRARVNRK